MFLFSSCLQGCLDRDNYPCREIPEGVLVQNYIAEATSSAAAKGLKEGDHNLNANQPLFPACKETPNMNCHIAEKGDLSVEWR
jgi:hypothetical protein